MGGARQEAMKRPVRAARLQSVYTEQFFKLFSSPSPLSPFLRIGDEMLELTVCKRSFPNIGRSKNSFQTCRIPRPFYSRRRFPAVDFEKDRILRVRLRQKFLFFLPNSTPARRIIHSDRSIVIFDRYSAP